MRLVLDTNIVASGLLWNGVPAQLVDAARADEIEIFTSRVLLVELTRILYRTKFANVIAASGLPLEELVLSYAELATSLHPRQSPQPSSTIPMTITCSPARLQPRQISSSPAIKTCLRSRAFEKFQS